MPSLTWELLLLDVPQPGQPVQVVAGADDHLHTADQIRGFFKNLDLVEPGATSTPLWRPESRTEHRKLKGRLRGGRQALIPRVPPSSCSDPHHNGAPSFTSRFVEPSE